MSGHVKHPFRGGDQLKVDVRIDDFFFVSTIGIWEVDVLLFFFDVGALIFFFILPWDFSISCVFAFPSTGAKVIENNVKTPAMMSRMRCIVRNVGRLVFIFSPYLSLRPD